MTTTNPLAADLDGILTLTEDIWRELHGARLFITGGTGFFGCWLLESVIWANARLGLRAEAVVLTRDAAAFARKCPHLATDPALQFHHGDICDFSFPDGAFTHVIHAATEASAAMIAQQPLAMFTTVVDGTRRALEFALARGAVGFLLTSSGAVYGAQPAEMTHIPEEYLGGPDPTQPAAAYGEGKRAAEQWAALYAKQHGLAVKIARCFAFLGPYLPLDRHFAAGNFIRDGLTGGPIRVGGDGTPYRSYLYAADLTAWLWTLLLRGQSCRAYNVGSETMVTIADLADTVAAAFIPRPKVHIARPPTPGQPAARYVPATRRAREELGLCETVPLAEGISRTIAWYSRT